MKTAAAFTKGLLELEGSLTPILASLVTVEDKQMLDKGGNFRIQEDMDACKTYMEKALQRDEDYSDELIDTLFPSAQKPICEALKHMKNPYQVLARIHTLIAALCRQVEDVGRENGELEFPSVKDEAVDMSSESELTPLASEAEGEEKNLYLNETFSLMLDRWEKLNKDFKNKKTGMYDLTKVPDVYDMVRYDVLHNSHIGLAGIEELLTLAREFADVVVPQEYGISKEEKMCIGPKMCGTLVEKIKYDLEVTMLDGGDADMHFSLDQT
jgi:inositol hexakisphosphate/diphosphoinositol-pentakisphosphate kinase